VADWIQFGWTMLDHWMHSYSPHGPSPQEKSGNNLQLPTHITVKMVFLNYLCAVQHMYTCVSNKK
jgi:hypothetical protein